MEGFFGGHNYLVVKWWSIRLIWSHKVLILLGLKVKCKDEARHGRAFEGLLNRYFGEDK